jgi:hypothetical protein
METGGMEYNNELPLGNNLDKYVGLCVCLLFFGRTGGGGVGKRLVF